jgi:MFS family permease
MQRVRRVYTVCLFIVMASIDNTVLGLLPALTPRLRAEFNISDAWLGAAIGVNLVVVAITALLWGYRGDQGDRRWLLICGTLAWALPVALVPLSARFSVLFGLIVLAGIGLGCISTVGYSIITDLVPQRWRGLILGLWGLAQGIGGLVGIQLAASSASWREPFGWMAAVGVACSGLALFAIAPRKGQADEALRALDEVDATYEYRIQPADLPLMLARPSNRWLILQGFVAQFTFGSLTLLVVLLTAKLVSAGLPNDLASRVAAQLLVVLQLGGVISLAWGWAGDRLQQRWPRIRALLAAYGFWAAIPCYMLLFWMPLPTPADTSGGALQIVMQQLGRNPWWALALLAATLATIAQATNAPNWYALVCEVNLPEHRGTAFSFITFANNIGRAIGAILVASTFGWLGQQFPAPINYALGLTLFQLFFIPAGLCFWLAARTTQRDAADVQATLAQRAAAMVARAHEHSAPVRPDIDPTQAAV